MWHSLLARELAKFVQQHVQLELGRQVAQSPVAERLQRPVGYHGAQEVHVADEGGEVWIGVGYRLAIGVVVFAGVEIEHTVYWRDLVVLVRGEVAFPGVTARRWRVHRVIYNSQKFVLLVFS